MTKKLILPSFAALFLCLACAPSDQSEGSDKAAAEPAPARAALPLPDFPDLPIPKTSLGADDTGVIYFQTRSPYDFSRVLRGFDDLPSHSGKGTLVLPEGASADDPSPAMVILHGSGGIKEGREFAYADWFADNGIAGFVVDYYSPRGVTCLLYTSPSPRDA